VNDKRKLLLGLNTIISLASAACDGGEEQFGYAEDDKKGVKAVVAAFDAVKWLMEMRTAIQHGGKVIPLSKAELNQLRCAAGNSTSDPDWYVNMTTTPHQRRALVSAAEKVGFQVGGYDGPRPRKKKTP